LPVFVWQDQAAVKPADAGEHRQKEVILPSFAALRGGFFMPLKAKQCGEIRGLSIQPFYNRRFRKT
jgi:hypothetical protein